MPWTQKIKSTNFLENSVLETTCLHFDTKYVVVGGGISDIWDFDPSSLLVPKTVQIYDIQTGKN